MICCGVILAVQSCLKPQPVTDYDAEYGEAMERLRSPDVYIAVSRFIQRRGHACPFILEIRPRDRFSSDLSTDPVEMVVTCETDETVSIYDVAMSRDNRSGTVELHAG